MNPKVSSKEEILATCREIVSTEGLNQLTVRRVADEAGIALGSIYNYFGSKEELILETIGSIWRIILKDCLQIRTEQTLCDYLGALYQVIQVGEKQFPGFLMGHGQLLKGAGKKTGQERMQGVFKQFEKNMTTCLLQDSQIRSDLWDEELNVEKFTQMIFPLFMDSLTKGSPSFEDLKILVNHYLYR